MLRLVVRLLELPLFRTARLRLVRREPERHVVNHWLRRTGRVDGLLRGNILRKYDETEGEKGKAEVETHAPLEELEVVEHAAAELALHLPQHVRPKGEPVHRVFHLGRPTSPRLHVGLGLAKGVLLSGGLLLDLRPALQPLGLNLCSNSSSLSLVRLRSDLLGQRQARLPQTLQVVVKTAVHLVLVDVRVAVRVPGVPKDRLDVLLHPRLSLSTKPCLLGQRVPCRLSTTAVNVIGGRQLSAALILCLGPSSLHCRSAETESGAAKATALITLPYLFLLNSLSALSQFYVTRYWQTSNIYLSDLIDKPRIYKLNIYFKRQAKVLTLFFLVLSQMV